jgi:crotonobetainyl-CoA:carnitine CoA-transferase CaiB-like acyl-CoA transferase
MRVVDLSTDVAGRFAAKLFAMASVDVMRPAASPEFLRQNENDPLTLYLDALKTTVSLDSNATLSNLLVDADLVFTSFDSGRYTGLASQRLDLPARCVQVTTSTFGSWGPYSSFRGGPLADWAAGGYIAITGDPDREPLIGPENLCAYLGGYTAALGAEAALRERRASGQGQHVDISTMESMLRLHQSTFSSLAGGSIRKRTGRYAEVYPLVVRPCKDGFVSLGVVTDEEFDRLAIAFDLPDLAANERFSAKEARWENRDSLDAELAKFLMQHNADEVVGLLQASAVASAKVADTQQVLTNPQLMHRRFWASPLGGEASASYMPGNPVPPATIFATSNRHSQPKSRTSMPDRRRTTKGLPLDGILVLDFTAFWAGPSATVCLADLGADVIWVERPRSRTDVDPRIAKPRALAQYLYHQKMNRHKHSVVLDLGTSAGRETARRLASKADILVENFRPGVAERLGLAPSKLCAAFPDLVYVSLSGFGSGGPWGEWRSFGPNIEAASSIMARTGYPDGDPMRLGHALPDGVGGLVGALAALRGLRERDDRGRGGWFDLSQLEAYVATSGEDILAASMTGVTFPRIGNRARSGAIQGVFRCKGDDQWIAIRLTGPTDIERFAAIAGSAALCEAVAEAPRDDDRIDTLIGAYTTSRDKSELAQALQQAEFEAFPALTSAELVADAHLAERGFFSKLRIADRSYALPGTPIHGSRPLADTAGRAPRFDEHTSAILEWLSS